MKRHARGALYAEVLVAVAIVAIALVPAADAIYAGLRSSEYFASSTDEHFVIVGRMEEVLAQPFAALEAAALAAGGPGIATTYSDPAGPGRRLVYLAYYDADDADADSDPFTGTEPDLLWVRVEIEGTSRGLETLLSQ